MIQNNYMYNKVAKVTEDKKLKAKIIHFAKKRQRDKDIIKKNMLEMASVTENSDKIIYLKEVNKARKRLKKTAKYAAVKYRKSCVLTGRTRGLKLEVDRVKLLHFFRFGHVAGSKKDS